MPETNSPLPPCYAYANGNLDRIDPVDLAERMAALFKVRARGKKQFQDAFYNWAKDFNIQLPVKTLEQIQTTACPKTCNDLKLCAVFAEGCNEAVCRRAQDEKRAKEEETREARIQKLYSNTAKVLVHQGTPTFYEVFFTDTETSFKAKDEDLLKQATYTTWHMNEYGKILRFERGEYDSLVEYWLNRAERQEKETLTDEDVAAELITNKIMSCVTVETAKEAMEGENRVFLEGEKLYVPNALIRRIHAQEKLPMTLVQLRHAFNGVISENTKVFRIGNRTARFWVFDNTKLGKNDKVVCFGGKENGEN